MSTRPDLDAAIDTSASLVFGVTKQMLRAKDAGELASLFDTATKSRKLAKLVGRVVLMFPEFEADPREVFEDAACGTWFEALEEKYAFAALMLEPTKTLPIFMLSQVPWTKKKGRIIPSDDEAMQFLLDRGMTAFAFGTWLGVDAKAFAAKFLGSVGLGSIVNDDLLDDFASMHDGEG